MNLAQLTQEAVRLDAITYRPSFGGGGFDLLVFHFAEQAKLALTVDSDADQLVWCDAPQERLRDLTSLMPSVGDAYGLALVWSWEMKNQQGYFDAVQIEVTDSNLATSVSLQFKVAASEIRVFRVVTTL